MSSISTVVGIITPSVENIGNSYYQQLLLNTELFPLAKISFVQIDVSTSIPTDVKALVVVGDSVATLETSFLQQCQNIFTNFKGPKLLLSQGLPSIISPDLVGTLNMFDHITVHSTTDLSNLKTVDKQNSLLGRVVYYPDLLYLMAELDTPSISSELQDGRRVIGICLPYSIASHNPFYKKLLGNFVDGLVHYYIMEPNGSDIQFQILILGEEDRKVATDLYYQCQSTFIGDEFPVTIYPETLTDITQTREYITTNLTHLISYDLTISQLSILAKKPTVILKPNNNTDNEIEKLAKDVDIDPASLVSVTISDRYLLPSGLNADDLVSALQHVTFTNNVSSARFPDTQTECIRYILDSLTDLKSNHGVVVGPITGAPGNVAISTEQINDRVTEMMKSVQMFNASRNQYDPGLVALYICYLITKKNESSKYHHGLQVLLDTAGNLNDLVQNGKLEGALRWLIKDAFAKGLTYDFSTQTTAPYWLTHSSASIFRRQPDFAISLDSVFRQPSYEGIHRSGWAYVASGLGELTSNDASVFCDLYADSTFGWMEEILNYEQVLPYTQPWVGFFHHGWSTDEAYDVSSAIAKPSFKASLTQCRCLITLSEDLKSKLELGLMQLQVDTPELQIPPVVAMVHPTEITPRSSQFTVDAFLWNENRKIVQVGSFYRNSFSIYALPLGDIEEEYPNELQLSKVHLKAVDSARYFRPANLFAAMTTLDQSTTSEDDLGDATTISRSICGGSSISSISRSICRTDSGSAYTTNNVYLQGLIKVAEKMDSSVEIMEHVSNDDYDALLSENIVFIDLVDCSGCNSLIECIVRNTPILVNPLPAVIEALGEGYPFYFTTLTEAAAKANSIELVTSATDYLAAMDKSALRLDYFLNDFQAKLAPYMTASVEVEETQIPIMKVFHKRKVINCYRDRKRLRQMQFST